MFSSTSILLILVGLFLIIFMLLNYKNLPYKNQQKQVVVLTIICIYGIVIIITGDIGIPISNPWVLISFVVPLILFPYSFYLLYLIKYKKSKK